VIGPQASLSEMIPGLDRVVSALDARPDIATILRELDRFERRLGGQVTSRRGALRVHELRKMHMKLLAVEEDLWGRLLQPETEWHLHRWVGQATAWLSALQISLEYADQRVRQQEPVQAFEALKSGALYAAEAAIAYTRLAISLKDAAGRRVSPTVVYGKVD
jgi:hypothetical protein